MKTSKLLLAGSIFAFMLIISSCKKDKEEEPVVNQKPVISSVQVNPNSINTGGVAIISVTASDPENSELTYSYTVSGGSINGSGAAVSWTAPGNAGTYNFTVTVSDGAGEVSETGNIEVLAPVNHNPVISSVILSSPNVDPGGNVTISVLANDEDGDALTYQYQVTGGAVAGAGASVIWTAPSQVGAYSVNVIVSDGNGGQAMSNAVLNVNQPVTQITGAASFPAGTSGDLSNAKVSLYTSFDNWNQNIPLMYVAANGTGSNITFTISDMPAGIYYLDVWKDNDNSSGWSYGDYVGWYGDGGLGAPSLTQIYIQEGETKTVDISMMIITGKSELVQKWITN